MSAPISIDSQLAIKFYEANLIENSPEKMRTLTSQNFSCTTTWSYGKEAFLENIEQYIGLCKLGVWTGKCKDGEFKVVKEGVLEASHKEKPNKLGSETFSKVANIWTFTFSDEKGERKIESLKIVTTVSEC